MGWRRRLRDRAAHHLSLAPGQRRAITLVLTIALALAAWRVASNPATIDDPQPPRGDRYDQLADRIDPNTAEVSDLATLPGLGEKRAKAIVEWRTAAQQRDGRTRVFERAEDLYKIKGIGPAMVDQMRPYLIFPASTTQPGEGL